MLPQTLFLLHEDDDHLQRGFFHNHILTRILNALSLAPSVQQALITSHPESQSEREMEMEFEARVKPLEYKVKAMSRESPSQKAGHVLDADLRSHWSTATNTKEWILLELNVIPLLVILTLNQFVMHFVSI